MQTCDHDVISAESISTLQWAGILDFVLFPLPYLSVIFGIVANYFMPAEVTKRWFYRQVKTMDDRGKLLITLKPVIRFM